MGFVFWGDNEFIVWEGSVYTDLDIMIEWKGYTRLFSNPPSGSHSIEG